jgi:DNA helicase HerA-like ATPase
MSKERNWFERAQQELGRLEFLQQAEVDLDQYLAAEMAEGHGLELVQLTKQHCFSQALLNVAASKHWRPEPVLADKDLILGKLQDRDAEVGIPFEKAPRGIGAFGGSGSGKTNSQSVLIGQFRQHGKQSLIWDFKGEVPLLPMVWDDAIVFTPQIAPWQWLEPVGDPLAYYIGLTGELRAEFELRPETYHLLYGIFERLLRGMRPGDPFPSFEDLRRVVEHEAREQKRENLYSIARALMSLCVVLGPQARVRKAAPLSKHYRVIGYNLVGTDPRIIRLFFGFHLNKLLLEAQERGHTTELQTAMVVDEGSILFSRELMIYGVSHISAAKRFASMARFTGTSLIVGAQNISQIDPFLLQNLGTLLVFRSPSYDDAVLAAKMLGLPSESIEGLMHLKVGEAWVRSEGWEQACKIQVPLFQP